MWSRVASRSITVVAPGAAADLVLAASPVFAEHLRHRTATPVEVLLQATDTDRFRPTEPNPDLATEVLFVGNSRKQRRPIVDAGLTHCNSAPADPPVPRPRGSEQVVCRAGGEQNALRRRLQRADELVRGDDLAE